MPVIPILTLNFARKKLKQDARWRQDQNERGYMDFKAQHELTAARERAQHAWLHQSVVDAGAAALGLPLRSSGGQLRMFPGVRTRRRLVERPAQPRADDDAVQRDRALGDAPRQGRRAARGRYLVGWSRPRVRWRHRVRDVPAGKQQKAIAQGARERPHPRRRGITRRGCMYCTHHDHPPRRDQRKVRTLYGTGGKKELLRQILRRPPAAAACRGRRRRRRTTTRSTAC